MNWPRGFVVAVRALLPAPVFAQADMSAPHPEIKGVVTEPGTLRPVPDVEVTLIKLPDQGPRIFGGGVKQDVVAATPI